MEFPMIKVTQRTPVGFLLAFIGLSGLGLNGCSDSPAAAPGVTPPGGLGSDMGAAEPPPTGSDPAVPGGDPSSNPDGTGEVPSAIDAPLDNSGGATGTDPAAAGAGGATATAGAGGAPAVPPLVPVDCPAPTEVPITR